VLSIFHFTYLSFIPDNKNRNYYTVKTETHPDFSQPIPMVFLKSTPPDPRIFHFDAILTKLIEVSIQGEDIQINYYRPSTVILLAQPLDRIPFVTDSFEDLLHQNHIDFKFFMMLDPIAELKKSLTNKKENSNLIAVVVYNEKGFYEKMIKQLQSTFKKIEIINEDIDFGSGYSAKVIIIPETDLFYQSNTTR
jgi:hypothetical protein